MPRVLLLEPDRVTAKCILDELSKRDMEVSIASNADDAVVLADKVNPDIVICELSLSGHSGSEFIYEFRTYTDWQDTPLVVYSSIKATDKITSSKDWNLLNIHALLYKPDYSLKKLGDLVEDLIVQS